MGISTVNINDLQPISKVTAERTLELSIEYQACLGKTGIAGQFENLTACAACIGLASVAGEMGTGYVSAATEEVA